MDHLKKEARKGAAVGGVCYSIEGDNQFSVWYVARKPAPPETGGGPLLFWGLDLVDEVLWLVDGDPTEVSADVRTGADSGADETLMLSFSTGDPIPMDQMTKAFPIALIPIRAYAEKMLTPAKTEV